MKIVIVDANPFSSACVQCAVGDLATVAADFDQKAEVFLWIKEAKSIVPKNVKIKDSDCFDRPFRMGAILDRVRRYASADGSRPDTAIGPYILNAVNNELINNQTGGITRLTDKETHILKFLSTTSDGFIDRETLLKEVWGYAENVETHTLETHIYRLRQKIEKDPSAPAILITDEQGYKLNV